MYMDADKEKAIFEMIDRRVDLNEVFKEMENDTTVSESVKKELISEVLNGRFFSKELDIHFGNEVPLLK